jgi:hypothetical protein
VASSADGDLFFVGRSPDSLFDVLSGIFAGTSWEERLRLLPVSLRWNSAPGSLPIPRQALRRYLASLELSPEQIRSRPRPTALVDMVATGRTFGELVTTWQVWSQELNIPWIQVRRKLRLIGITERAKTSPKTWRWQQHVTWAALLAPGSIKNVSVPWWFWDQLNDRPKASRTFPPEAWANPDLSRPPRHWRSIDGLRDAVCCYQTGRTAAARERFVAELLRGPSVRSAWLRALAHELRSRPG